MLIFNKITFAQPIDYLIKKYYLKMKVSIHQKFIIEKAKMMYLQHGLHILLKLNLTVPLGREVLINNDSANTDLNFYELDAKN